MKLTEAKQILEAAHTHNIDLTEDGVKQRLYEAKKVFVSHYRDNPQGFLEDFVKILDGKTNEEIPFKFNKAQWKATRALKKNRKIASPKARQLGITTWTNGVAFHHAIFIKNANVVCMAVKTDNAKENLRRIRTMYSTMPDWVKKMVIGEIFIDNSEQWAFHSKITKTSNKMEVASASSEDGTRGKTPTFLHWTETAFADLANQIFTSIYPALNRRKDSVVVLESTGNGNAGFYYEVCMGTRKGFEVVFMPWHLDSDYTAEGDTLSSDEKELIAEMMGVEKLPEYLDDGQLRWYRDTSETLGKAKCQQEYPINVEQVFQATSSSFFSTKTMQKINPKPVLYALSYSDGFLSKRNNGACKVFETPKNDYEYLVSVDPSDGVNDPSSVMVFNPDGMEVAHWHEKVQADDLVKLLIALSKHYNNAKILCEANGIGEYVTRALRSQYFYPNIYQEDGKLGVRTSSATKPVMLSLLQEFILSERLDFSNPTLLEEMKTFDAETMKAQKGDGIHDDVVMSAAFAAWGFNKQPPKKKRLASDYRDYSNIVDNNSHKRRFILGGAN